MSSGSVLIEPAVVVVSVAEQAAEGAVTAPAEYERALEQAAAAQSRAAVDHPVWMRVAANVVELNARIRMAGARAKRAGVPIDVPGPLGLSGRSVADAAQWCTRTARELTIVQKVLHAAVAIGQTQEAIRGLPRSGSAEYRAETTSVLDRYQEMLLRRYEPTRAPAFPPIDVTDVEVETVLLRLDQDAFEHERAEVLRTAAAVRTGPGEAGNHLLELRRRVFAVNAAVERRRLAAGWLAALEEPAVAGLLRPDSGTGTAARLRAVVRGDVDLTADLRRDAEHTVEAAAELTRRAYLAAEVSSCLTGLGYTVGAEFDVQNSTMLVLHRADGPDHVARVSVTGRGLAGLVLRKRHGAGDAAEASDLRECGVFHEGLGAVGRRVGAEVTVGENARPPVIEPGALPDRLPGLHQRSPGMATGRES